MVDLTKAELLSQYDAFKNNNVFTGTLAITGSVSEGTNIRTYAVDLGLTPDMTSIMFNGPTGGTDPRPSDGWFKQGAIYVPTNNAGGGNPSRWVITASIVGTIVTITATYSQQFVTGETLTSTNFSYRIVDYSVF